MTNPNGMIASRPGREARPLRSSTAGVLAASALAVSAILAGCAAPQKALVVDGRPSVAYTVSVPRPEAEIFEVNASLDNIPGDTITYHFPVWAPGAYDVVNFGAYVTTFSATGEDGRPLRVLRGDTNTFRIIGGGGRRVSLAYKVHDIETNPASLWFGLSDIEPRFAFANGTALFGYPAGYKDAPAKVTYVTPRGWDIAIGLDPSGEPGTYVARNYDELVDAPLTMGKFQRYQFTVSGKPHIISVIAPEDLDSERARSLVTTTDTIVRIVSGFFGDMPYERYVFQHYLVTPGPGDYLFGALEHANSSTYRMPYSRSRQLGRELASVIAHEYWHLWSPKRFHVAALGPFDYQQPPRTKSLWFAEGLTEYYAKVLLTRNNMMDRSEILDMIESVANGGRNRPQLKSITEISQEISYVDPLESIQLYSKGPVVGFLLDAEIRLQTGNRRSLDDAMRFFNERFGRTGRTFGDDDIIPLMEEATGTKLAEFYRRYVDGREALPIESYLTKVGFALERATEERTDFGAELTDDPQGWRVVSVVPGATADSSGLQVGDVITGVTFGPARVTPKDLKVPAQAIGSAISQFPAGGGLEVSRGGSTLKLTMVTVTQSVPVIRVGVDESASGTALEIRKGMLGF